MTERHFQPHGSPTQLSRRLIFASPVIGFFGAVLGLGLGMRRDPSLVPSALIGKPVPQFRLPPVKGRRLGLASTDLIGSASLVNVFASWCTACRAEHSLLVRLKEQGAAPIHGINYEDKPEDAAAWLDELGDPYLRTGADLDGRVSIDWGVCGVPETYVVDRSGRIAYKQIGPLSRQILDDTILPLIARLTQ